MLKKIVQVLMCTIGICLISYGFQRLHFKITDTRILPFFTPSYYSIFSDLTYGISLLVLSYFSFKQSKRSIDLTIVLLSFPIFNQVAFFLNYGLLLWIIALVILLSNMSLVYKLMTLLLFSIFYNYLGYANFDGYINFNGDPDFYDYINYHTIFIHSSIALLVAMFIIEIKSLSDLRKHKMSRQNKLYFGIILIPYLLSELATYI